ncbi:helix-turn-helix transcriptional regulator [Desulfovibrio sp. JY]|nr:helix-turn-helix transcriptional regulator [Desulfovibrio sp. JY]
MVRKRSIKIWMLKRGLSVQDVADGAGVHQSYVYHFLAGKKKALVIRDWFLGQGCPAKYLGEGKKEAA